MDKERIFLESDGILVTDESGNKYLLFPLNDSPQSNPIENFLLHIGIPKVSKGYSFLVTAIELGLKDPDYLKSFGEKLYPALKEKYHLSADSISGEIRRELIRCKQNENYKKLFGNASMTPKRFITTLVNHFTN